MNDNSARSVFTDDLKQIQLLVKVLIIILLLSLSAEAITALFDKYVVDKVICLLYKERLNILQTIISILLTFYGLFFIAEKISRPKYKASFSFILMMMVPLYWYFYERCFNQRYDFIKIFDHDKWGGLRLLDLPFGLLGLVLAVFIVNRLCEAKQTTDNELMIDLPLKLLEQDDYERKQVYDGLLKQIASLNFEVDKSFCIGIANSWGEGKTSFLNFLEQELALDDQTIVIKFNPWFSSNSDNLTLDFFQHLDKELSKYVYTGSTIRKYANNLTTIDSIFNPAKYLPKSWIGEKSHQESFNEIDELIKRIDKRIFIFIDDLDRLDNKEVFNVIKTIRNTASFTKTHFVVPFDKAYVNNALSENKVYGSEAYMKKIFDVEIVLPPISKTYLQRILYQLFEDFFKHKMKFTDQQQDEYLLQIKRIIYEEGHSLSNLNKYASINISLFNTLKNKRDIIRFFNGMVLAIKTNYKWVYLPDLVMLETIKYIDVKLYKKLFENDHYLVKKDEETLGRQYYKLAKKVDNEDDIVESTMNKRHCDYHLISTIENKDMKNLISNLFSLPDKKEFNAKYAFAYTLSFNNYFQYRENGITYEDLENLING